MALVAVARGFRAISFGILSTVLIALWIASTPVFANWLYGTLEFEYPAVAIDSLPSADAAILLGGVLAPPLPPRVTFDLSDLSDRIVEALGLYRAGKVNHILISGGNLPWQADLPAEAELIAGFLSELGVPRDAMVLEDKSRNTRENAVNSVELFKASGWKTGLLVTSAAHMPRALATFRKAGLNVVPATADVRVRFPLYDSLLDFLPDADALARTTAGMKEIIGLQFYRLRGWA